MNEQLLHQCAGCGNYVHVDVRLCKTCFEAPDISIRMMGVGYTERRTERRQQVRWDFVPDRRANIDRRGMSTKAWLSAVEAIGSYRKFSK